MMLPKPSIFKIPQASSSLYQGLNGCNSGYTVNCQSGYSSGCVDNNSCSWNLAVGLGGGAVIVGIGAIALT